MSNEPEYIIYEHNPKIDYLLLIYGGKPIPPKHDQFKPIEAYEMDENGNARILNEFYVKKPGKNAVIEFENMLKKTASEKFNEENRIKKPSAVEVVISVSALEKQFKEVDVDNLAKSVLDGLKGVAYDDDSQVTNLIINKNIHPLKMNMLFIGITNLNKENRGVSCEIRLFREKEFSK